jgi:hypothetical protein
MRFVFNWTANLVLAVHLAWIPVALTFTVMTVRDHSLAPWLAGLIAIALIHTYSTRVCALTQLEAWLRFQADPTIGHRIRDRSVYARKMGGWLIWLAGTYAMFVVPTFYFVLLAIALWCWADHAGLL